MAKELKTGHSLANRWRPKTWDDVCGHVNIVSRLKGMLESRSLPNAILFAGPSGTGKCVTGSTLVHTADGIVPISSLINEDGFNENSSLCITNAFGNYERTTHTYRKKSECYKARSSSGFFIEGTPNHPMLVINGEDGKLVWKPLESLTDEDYFVVRTTPNPHPSKFVRVPVENVESSRTKHRFRHNGKVTEDVAFILGVLVSEGSLSSGQVRIHNTDRKYIKEYLACWKRLDSTIQHSENMEGDDVIRVDIRNCTNVRSYLKDCGLQFDVSAKQRIPHVILKSPKEVRVAFLRALFEGDGGWNGSVVSYYTKSHRLLQELRILLLDFGIYSQVRSKQVETTRGLETYYTLNISSDDLDTFMQEIGFFSARKNSGYEEKPRNTNVKVVPPSLRSRVLNVVLKMSSRNGRYKDFLDRDLSVSFQGLAGQNSVKGWGEWALDNYERVCLLGNMELVECCKDLITLYGMGAVCEQVSFVSKTKERVVYDVTLPRTHSFLANGLISHNTTLSRVFARYINCEHGTSCGECDSCRMMDNVTHPDYMEVDAGSSGGINDIRSLIDQAQKMPMLGNIRVIVLDESQALSPAAQTAILKTLEEPPEHTLFILATMQVEKISPAVLGRCQRMDLKRVLPEYVEDHLKMIAKREKIKLPADVYGKIANATGGQLRNALQTLDAVNQTVLGSNKEDIDSVIEDAVLEATSLGDETLATNVLTYLYNQKDSKGKPTLRRLIATTQEVQSAVSFANSLLWQNDYLITTLANPKSNKIYHTPVNTKCKTAVGKVQLDVLLMAHSHLLALRQALVTLSGQDTALIYKHLSDAWLQIYDTCQD